MRRDPIICIRSFNVHSLTHLACLLTHPHTSTNDQLCGHTQVMHTHKLTRSLDANAHPSARPPRSHTCAFTHWSSCGTPRRRCTTWTWHNSSGSCTLATTPTRSDGGMVGTYVQAQPWPPPFVCEHQPHHLLQQQHDWSAALATTIGLYTPTRL
jgi:hypothetical protein